MSTNGVLKKKNVLKEISDKLFLQYKIKFRKFKFFVYGLPIKLEISMPEKLPFG